MRREGYNGSKQEKDGITIFPYNSCDYVTRVGCTVYLNWNRNGFWQDGSWFWALVVLHRPYVKHLSGILFVTSSLQINSGWLCACVRYRCVLICNKTTWPRETTGSRDEWPDLGLVYMFHLLLTVCLNWIRLFNLPTHEKWTHEVFGDLIAEPFFRKVNLRRLLSIFIVNTLIYDWTRQ